MAETNGSWLGNATLAGGVDTNKDTHVLNCDTSGTLEVAGIVTVLPGSIIPVSIDQTGTNNVVVAKIEDTSGGTLTSTSGSLNVNITNASSDTNPAAGLTG